MKHQKTFPFEKARRATLAELKEAHKAIEQLTGKKRPFRGRPPKPSHERYLAVSIRLHPKVVKWAKTEAKKRGLGYQSVINEVLLKSAG
jgi:uncharacterized protein (DUF4415 family)